MRFRRLPSVFWWPCKLAIVVVLIVQTIYLFDLLRTIIGGQRECLNLHHFDTNLKHFPVYKQQNVPTLGSEPLNWLKFDYKIQPKCPRNSTATVIVHTKAENLDQRSHFRRQLNGYRPTFVLFHNSTYLTQLKVESEEFNDLLVVGGVTENYHNITHKARAWITWLNEKCNSIATVLKLDDDVHLNSKALPKLFELFNGQKSLVLCRVLWDGQVTRNSKSKWFLDKKEYKAANLGTYCQGMAYAFSGDLLPKMGQNMNHVQFLWMDDWYVTHALLNGTQATYIDIGRHIISTNSREELQSVIENKALRYTLLFAHFRPNDGLDKSIEHWNRIRQC